MKQPPKNVKGEQLIIKVAVSMTMMTMDMMMMIMMITRMDMTITIHTAMVDTVVDME